MQREILKVSITEKSYKILLNQHILYLEEFAIEKWEWNENRLYIV